MADVMPAEEKQEAAGTGPSKEELRQQKAQQRWAEEIRFYESKAGDWHKRAKKIISRYKDDRKKDVTQSAPRFNVLWSNVQTLKPALYGRLPKPDIERRYRDKDDVGRVTSMVLERAITFFVNEHFNAAMKNAVQDRLLPGRGTLWARYEPHFRDETMGAQNPDVQDDGVEITDSVEAYGEPDDAEEAQAAPETYQVVDREDVCYDYVHYEDFGHTFGRTWDEVDAEWRKVYLTKPKLAKRFGKEKADKIPLDYMPSDLKNSVNESVEKKATIYEIWDKETRKAIWLHLDYTESLLDEQDDPLGLDDFFPSPRPMYATLGNDDLMPVPDYIEYQDQAIELDQLTARIGSITKSIKVAGVYDKTAEGVQRLLSEGVENQLIPVEQWAVFAGQKGGLQGAMQLMPMKEIMETLLGLYEARDRVKQDLYEITGISDIIRGTNDAASTATAERIKGQFGTLRLTDQQDEVQRYVRDLVKIGTEIIAKHFGMDTLQQISGVKLLTNEEKMMLQPWYQAQMAVTTQMKAQQGAAPGQPPQSPMIGHNGGPPMQGAPPQPGPVPGQPSPNSAPAPQPAGPAQMPPPAQPPQANPQALLPPQFANVDEEELLEMMDEASWEEVYSLLRSEPLLAYKIDIETDSTIKFDQDAERAARVDFLTAVGGFIQSATHVDNPDLAPLMAKLLMFGVRGFKIGKELEAAFDVAIRKLEKDAENPSKQPSPEIMKIQADMKLDQEKGQREMAQIQAQAQSDNEQAKAQRQFDMAKLKQEGDNDMAKAKLDSETRIIVAQIAAKTSLKQAAISASVDPEKNGDPTLNNVDVGDGDTGPTINDLVMTVVKQLESTLTGMQASHQQLAQAIQKPRQVVRDPATGDIVGLQ